MDDLLRDLDEFLRRCGLPGRSMTNRGNDEGMYWDIRAAVCSVEAFYAEEMPLKAELDELDEGAIVVWLPWKSSESSLEKLDSDFEQLLDHFREGDVIVGRRVYPEQHLVVYDVFTGSRGEHSHYHCVQFRVSGPDVDQAIARYVAAGRSEPRDPKQEGKLEILLNTLRGLWAEKTLG